MKKFSIFLLTAFLFVSLLSAITGATTWHEFPDFETEGELIGGEYVYTMEILDAVPSYLNSSSNGGYGSGASYYQCTEYIARYLYSQFGTDYTDQKDIDDDNTQGFVGDDFHPNYSGSPPQPTIDRGNDSVRLRKITVPKTGDIVIDTDKNHSALVQSIDGITIDLVEQNWIWNDSGTYKYTTDRTINTNDSNTYFYRFDPVGYYTDGWHSDGSSQSIFEAYVVNGYTDLGGPCDHGGGERVHEYTFVANGNNVTVHLQDLAKDDNCTDNQTTLSYLPGEDNAYLLKGCIGCIWWKYKKLLGAPVSNEIEDISQFPEKERDDGFDVMQIFQIGSVFWDRETEKVRILSDIGSCEEDTQNTQNQCLPCSVETPFLTPQWEKVTNKTSADIYPSCTELNLNSGLDNGPWVMFRHNVQHTGRSANKGTEFPSLKWRNQVNGQILSSPVIDSEGTIYVGSARYWPLSPPDYLYAFYSDGNLKWQCEMGSSIQSAPAISSDGTIYVLSDDFYLYAIDTDGNQKWRFLTGYKHPNYMFHSSPAIGSDGTIYVGGQSEPILYAINPDGSLKWQFGVVESVVSSPAIDTDGTIYVASTRDLYAINSDDGTLKWSYSTGQYMFSSPAIGTDGTVYIGSADSYHGYLYAIYPDGNLRWRYEVGSGINAYSSPAIDTDGTIYVGSMDDYLYAIYPDGTLKWRFKTQGDIFSSPAIDADGNIYVGSWDNYIYAILPNGNLKWRYQTGDRIVSSPAIDADGTIYVGSSDDYIYAIGLIGDFDLDSDIDGSDLSYFASEYPNITNPSLSEFASNFGK